MARGPAVGQEVTEAMGAGPQRRGKDLGFYPESVGARRPLSRGRTEADAGFHKLSRAARWEILCLEQRWKDGGLLGSFCGSLGE